MKSFSIKIYGVAKESPGYRALTDFEITAQSPEEAARIARRNYVKKYTGMKITHCETGGCRRFPGSGVAL